MRKSAVQISLWDIYDGVSEAIEQHKPQLIRLLEEHIDFDRLIPVSFRYAFYRYMGRKHIYHLESFIRAFVIQKLLGTHTDTLLLSLLRLCAELRDFCGFDKVPDASQLTRFRDQYRPFLAEIFVHLVELTEPICREIDSNNADYFIYDTTGIELPVAENNPKFFSTKLREAKKFAKSKHHLLTACTVYQRGYPKITTCSGTTMPVQLFCLANATGIKSYGCFPERQH